MEEDDNYIIKVERKPFYGDFVAFLFLFGTFFITLFCFMAGWYLICLSILAFAVIIVLLIRRGIRKNKIIVSDFKENKEPKVALNEKNENISKNTDVLRGKEEAEVTLSDSINIPENYIPKTEPKKPVGYYSFLSYDKVLENNLRVMDLTAITLCKENNIPIQVFNIKETGALKNLILGGKIGTLVSE